MELSDTNLHKVFVFGERAREGKHGMWHSTSRLFSSLQERNQFCKGRRTPQDSFSIQWQITNCFARFFCRGGVSGSFKENDQTHCFIAFWLNFFNLILPSSGRFFFFLCSVFKTMLNTPMLALDPLPSSLNAKNQLGQ